MPVNPESALIQSQEGLASRQNIPKNIAFPTFVAAAMFIGYNNDFFPLRTS